MDFLWVGIDVLWAEDGMVRIMRVWVEDGMVLWDVLRPAVPSPGSRRRPAVSPPRPARNERWQVLPGEELRQPEHRAHAHAIGAELVRARGQKARVNMLGIGMVPALQTLAHDVLELAELSGGFHELTAGEGDAEPQVVLLVCPNAKGAGAAGEDAASVRPPACGK